MVSSFQQPLHPSIGSEIETRLCTATNPTFVEICSFFGLLVWLVPFALFVSLSAHDNLLPHHLDKPDDKKKNNGFGQSARR